MQGRGVSRGYHLGIANDNRHDRHTGPHGEPERPLLERADGTGVQTCSLRSDHYRQALAGQLLGLLQGLDSGLGVLAVDKHRVQQLAQRAENRVVREFLLADAGPIVFDEGRNDDRIEVVAVVENENRRSLLRQVLLTEHIKVHAVGRQQQLRESRREDIYSAPLAAGKQSPTYRRIGRRHRRTDAEQGAHLSHQSAATPAAELQDRPASLACHLGHLVAGVCWTRVTHQIHQRDVLVAVGIEVTVLQIDVVRGGKLLHCVGLARSPQDRRNYPAGQYAVVIDLEPVGQDVRDAQIPRHRFHLNCQSG